MLPEEHFKELSNDEMLIYQHLLQHHVYNPEMGGLSPSVIAKEINRYAVGQHKDRYTAFALPICLKLSEKGLIVSDDSGAFRVDQVIGVPVDMKSKKVEDYYNTHVKPHMGRIKALRAKDKSINDVAKSIGMHGSTLMSYARQFPELHTVLKSGQVDCVSQVEASLFQRSVGYEYTEEKTKELFDKEGNSLGLFEVTKTKRHMPADGASMRFYLLNRERGAWRHSSHIENFIGKLSVTNILGIVAKTEEQRSLKPLDPAKEISMASIIEQQEAVESAPPE